MEYNREDGFEISVRKTDEALVISANRAGLLSLANHLRAPAESGPANHFHLDAYNSLEGGSTELVVEKMDTQNSKSGR